VGRYAVGDEVTIEYDDEGETDTLTGIITGFKPHSDTGEPGLWLRYTIDWGQGPRTFVSWWALDSVVASNSRSGAAP
jgi:hypothetical protein